MPRAAGDHRHRGAERDVVALGRGERPGDVAAVLLQLPADRRLDRSPVVLRDQAPADQDFGQRRGLARVEARGCLRSIGPHRSGWLWTVIALKRRFRSESMMGPRGEGVPLVEKAGRGPDRTAPRLGPIRPGLAGDPHYRVVGARRRQAPRVLIVPNMRHDWVNPYGHPARRQAPKPLGVRPTRARPGDRDDPVTKRKAPARAAGSGVRRAGARPTPDQVQGQRGPERDEDDRRRLGDAGDLEGAAARVAAGVARQAILERVREGPVAELARDDLEGTAPGAGRAGSWP